MTDSTDDITTHAPWHHHFAPHMMIALPLPVIALAVWLVVAGYLPLANGIVITAGCSAPIAVGVYDLQTREVAADD